MTSLRPCALEAAGVQNSFCMDSCARQAWKHSGKWSPVLWTYHYREKKVHKWPFLFLWSLLSVSPLIN